MDRDLRRRFVGSSRELEVRSSGNVVVEQRGRFAVEHAHKHPPAFNFLQVSSFFFSEPIEGQRPSHRLAHQQQPNYRNQRPQSQDAETLDGRELVFLYEHLNDTDFRYVLIASLPRLAMHIIDDDVFLNLQDLSCLPPDSEEEVSYDSDSSWSRSERGSGKRASATIIRELFRSLGQRSTLTAMVFILGIKLTQLYRLRLHELQQAWDRQSTPTSMSSTASHLSSVVPSEVIKSGLHIVIVGVMLANKYTEDRPHSNAAWAHLTGISAESLNRLENCFLRTIGHRMFVGEGEFKEWILTLSRLLQWVPEQQRMVWSTQPPGAMAETPKDVAKEPRPQSRFLRYIRKSTGGEHRHEQAKGRAPSQVPEQPPGFEGRNQRRFEM